MMIRRIFLDESALFNAIKEQGELTEDMIAFLGSDRDHFDRFASGYGFDSNVSATIEAALSSERIMLRAPTQSRPDVPDFEEWIERWTEIKFRYFEFTELRYYHKAEARSAMEMSEQFDDHSIFI